MQVKYSLDGLMLKRMIFHYKITIKRECKEKVGCSVE